MVTPPESANSATRKMRGAGAEVSENKWTRTDERVITYMNEDGSTTEKNVLAKGAATPESAGKVAPVETTGPNAAVSPTEKVAPSESAESEARGGDEVAEAAAHDVDTMVAPDQRAFDTWTVLAEETGKDSAPTPSVENNKVAVTSIKEGLMFAEMTDEASDAAESGETGKVGATGEASAVNEVSGTNSVTETDEASEKSAPDQIGDVRSTPATLTILFVDNTKSGWPQVGAPVILAGTLGSTGTYHALAPSSYILADDSQEKISYKMVTPSAKLVVYLQHDTRVGTLAAPNGFAPAQLAKTVERVIGYQFENGTTARADVVQVGQLMRTATRDLVDDTVTYGDWTAAVAGHHFAEVVSPPIAGYTAEAASVERAPLTETFGDEKIIVTYLANEQRGDVVFFDDTTKQWLQTENFTGKTNGTSAYTTAGTISAYAAQGYELVSDSYPAAGVTFSATDLHPQTYSVHLEHGTKLATATRPNGADVAELTATVTRLIAYHYENGNLAAPGVEHVISFTRTGMLDAVTGKMLSFTDWVAVDEKTWVDERAGLEAGLEAGSESGSEEGASGVPSFESGSAEAASNVPSFDVSAETGAETVASPVPSFVQVVSPEFAGYTADLRAVEAAVVTAETADSFVDVTYFDDRQKGTVIYVDDTTGRQLEVATYLGRLDGVSAYRTDAALADFAARGYELVSDGYPENGVVFAGGGLREQAPTYSVHLVHGVKMGTLDNPNGAETALLENVVQREIAYRYTDGREALALYTDVVRFTRTADVDAVTGEVITYSAWASVTGTAEFPAVATPALSGYTPDQAQVGATTVAPEAPDLATAVLFLPPGKHGAVVYLDDTTNRWLQTTPLAEATTYRTAPTLASYQAQGYELVSDSYPANGVTFADAQPDTVAQIFAVHLKHGVKVATATALKDADQLDLTRTIERIVTFQFENGVTAAPSVRATITFTRTASLDAVTDDLLGFNPWVAQNSNPYGTLTRPTHFASVTPPTLAGYDPDIAKVEKIAVTADTENIAIAITYLVDAQKGAVVFFDDTLDVWLQTDNFSGKTNEKVSYSTAPTLANYQARGYELVSSDFPADGQTFAKRGNKTQIFSVHLSHGTKIATLKAPNGWPETDLTRTVTRTITYQFADGQEASAPVHHEIDLTRDALIDTVTNRLIHYQNLQSTGTSFPEVKSPKIKGFTPDLAKISAMPVTKETLDVDLVVTYKNGRATAAGSGQTGTTATAPTSEPKRSTSSRSHARTASNAKNRNASPTSGSKAAPNSLANLARLFGKKHKK